MSLIIRGFIVFVICVLANCFVAAQDPFITEWKTDTDGETITISTNSTYTYSFTVDWGDGSAIGAFDNSNFPVQHAYAAAGKYNVKIIGDYPSFYLNGTGDKDKLTLVVLWGDIVWKTMEQAFDGASNMNITATDSPALDSVESMQQIFSGCTSLNANLDTWVVRNVELSI